MVGQRLPQRVGVDLWQVDENEWGFRTDTSG
jgi:hypothetical protein